MPLEEYRELQTELRACQEEVKTLQAQQEWQLGLLVDTKVKYADVCTKMERLTTMNNKLGVDAPEHSSVSYSPLYYSPGTSPP